MDYSQSSEEFIGVVENKNRYLYILLILKFTVLCPYKYLPESSQTHAKGSRIGFLVLGGTEGRVLQAAKNKKEGFILKMLQQLQ